METGITPLQTVSLIISIISVVICVITFFNNSKKETKKDTSEEQYRQGRLDQQLKNIFEKLDKIETKLDNYDNEIDIRIETALEHHIKEYHKN